MAEITHEIYMEVLDYFNRGKLLIDQEDVFNIDSHMEIGKIAVDLALHKFPNIKFNELKTIVCRWLNYSKEDFDVITDEELYQLISEKIINFKTLPITEIENVYNSQTALISKYESIKATVLQKLEEIHDLIKNNEENPANNGSLIKRKESLKSKNNANKKLTKDLREIELEYETITEEIQNHYVYQEMLKYALSQIESLLDKVILNLTNDELKYNIREIVINIAIDPSEIRTSYNYYNHYIWSLEAWEDTITSLYKPFFKIKFRKFYDDIFDFYYKNTYHFHNKEDELLSICKEKSEQLVPSDVWIRIKFCDEKRYQEMLSDTIQKYDVLAYCKQIIEDTYCLQNRCELLQLILSYYELEQYLVFINLAVIQIEGLFKDLFIDANIRDRLIGNFDMYESDDLRKKFDKNIGLSEIEEATIYFKFYFNNLMRNKVAHGNIYSNTRCLKVVASELLLDMQFVLYLASEKSETNEAISYIRNTTSWLEFSLGKEQTKENIYRRLLSKLNENVISTSKWEVGYGDTQQELYWVFNTYYHDAYSFSDIMPLKDKLVEYLTSLEFWEFVLSYLTTYDPIDVWQEIKIKSNFKSRVKAIMGYVSINEINSLQKLIKVYQKLEELAITD